MKIAVAALSRFHLFEQAAQLARAGLLHRLITGYPVWAMGAYDGLAAKAVSLPQYAAWRQATVWLERWGAEGASSRIRRRLYSSFSRATAKALQGNEEVVIGLSAFMREVIGPAKDAGSVVIVDHGSLHVQAERTILLGECERFGFRPFGNWRHVWMIERMQEEFEHADYVFCCSGLAKKTMMEHGVPAKKIVINHPGVNLAAFRPSFGHRRRDRLFRFIMVGGITPIKGVHYLLDAFEKLTSRVELWLVGSLFSDPAMRRRLQRSVERTGRIRVWGSVPEVRLVDLYRQCDAFVLPSLADGWGMVVNQAMACGLPVIVSDMTGAKEIVEEDVTGYVVPSRNVAALAASMEKLAEDRERALAMGMAAARSVARDMTWDAYGERLILWLKRAVR